MPPKQSYVAPLAVAAILLIGGAGRTAQAYPQWQFTSGTSRCNQCHFSPAGGGLINGYGRDAAGTELSTWKGNGGFLHGAAQLPKWLALGFDGRGAFVDADVGSPQEQRAVFPMQTDAYGRAAFGDAFSLSVTAGYRGRARSADTTIAADNYQPAAVSSFVSREHYLMWRPSPLGVYVRAGRFFAPNGLRLVEHTTYVRRDLGFGLLEESYALSGGLVRDDWEMHLTAFGPDVLQHTGNREYGGAGMFERRMADVVAVGVDGRAGRADGAGRYQLGVFGKAFIAPLKTLLMTELTIVQHVLSQTAGKQQFVGFGGVTVIPVRGLWLAAFLERNQTAISVKDSATNAVDGQVNWFPYPHFELVLLGRIQQPSGQTSARTGMIQVHYYL